VAKKSVLNSTIGVFSAREIPINAKSSSANIN
jgi:hypothetical protein